MLLFAVCCVASAVCCNTLNMCGMLVECCLTITGLLKECVNVWTLTTVIVPGKNGCSRRWAGVLTKSYCKKLPRGVRGNILIIHVCCGPQSTYMNLPQTDWQTVCLCICVFVSWTKTNSKKVEADEIYQRPWNMGRGMIPTFIDYPALVGRFVRLCWLYKQPGDWFAPAWSMLPQVKRAVPSARCLLFLAARGVLSIAEVSLSCSAGRPDNVKLSTSFCPSYLRSMIPFSSPFFGPPHPQSHPIPFHALTSPPISPSGRTHACYALRVWKSIILSQHCLNFQLRTLRFVSPDASITTAQPLRAAANTPLCVKRCCAAGGDRRHDTRSGRPFYQHF